MAQLPARTWLAGPEDAPQVTRLMLAFRDWWGRDWPSDEQFAAGVDRLLTDPDTEFLLAASNGNPDDPVGVIQIRFRWAIWHAASDCWLEDLYVEGSARRQRIASSLVEFACQRATERGCRRIELDVSEANTAAKALYERLGFGFKSDPARDLMMRRHLG